MVSDGDVRGSMLSRGLLPVGLLLAPSCARPLWDHAGMADDQLVRVFSSGDAFRGELMRGRLEADGIPVMMKGEGGGPYHAGPVYLWVPGSFEIAAKAVVDAVASGAFAIDELPEDEDAADAADPV